MKNLFRISIKTSILALFIFLASIRYSNDALGQNLKNKQSNTTVQNSNNSTKNNVTNNKNKQVESPSTYYSYSIVLGKDPLPEYISNVYSYDMEIVKKSKNDLFYCNTYNAFSKVADIETKDKQNYQIYSPFFAPLNELRTEFRYELIFKTFEEASMYRERRIQANKDWGREIRHFDIKFSSNCKPVESSSIYYSFAIVEGNSLFPTYISNIFSYDFITARNGRGFWCNTFIAFYKIVDIKYTLNYSFRLPQLVNKNQYDYQAFKTFEEASKAREKYIEESKGIRFFDVNFDVIYKSGCDLNIPSTGFNPQVAENVINQKPKDNSRQIQDKPGKTEIDIKKATKY